MKKLAAEKRQQRQADVEREESERQDGAKKKLEAIEKRIEERRAKERAAREPPAPAATPTPVPQPAPLVQKQQQTNSAGAEPTRILPRAFGGGSKVGQPFASSSSQVPFAFWFYCLCV